MVICTLQRTSTHIYLSGGQGPCHSLAVSSNRTPNLLQACKSYHNLPRKKPWRYYDQSIFQPIRLKISQVMASVYIFRARGRNEYVYIIIFFNARAT